MQFVAPTDAQAEDERRHEYGPSSLTDSEYAYAIDKLGEGAMGRLFGV